MKLSKEEKARLLADPEMNQHEWKKHFGMITCKKCGLIKGSGFAKCEPKVTDKEGLLG